MRAAASPREGCRSALEPTSVYPILCRLLPRRFVSAKECGCASNRDRPEPWAGGGLRYPRNSSTGSDLVLLDGRAIAIYDVSVSHDTVAARIICLCRLFRSAPTLPSGFAAGRTTDGLPPQPGCYRAHDPMRFRQNPSLDMPALREGLPYTLNMYLRIYVCMYVSMYLSIYVSMYVCIYIHRCVGAVVHLHLCT